MPQSRSAGQSLSLALNLALLYFALVFAVGWVLGPIRELLVVPRFGHTAGHLAELPLMLAATFLAARWIVRRSHIGGLAVLASVGLLAFVFLMAAEVAGTWLMRGLTLPQYFATFTPVTAAATICAYALFAAMPLLVAACGARHA